MPAGLPLIPGFTLLELLGSGGMGMVYKARHDRLDRLVALKVLRAEHLAEPVVVERFQREARAAARLSHPHIVTLYDADEAEGIHFLVMEYVAGSDLGRLVAERGPLPVDLAGELLRQAARALQHAHGHSLVHRDIKPSNLLVSLVPGPLSLETAGKRSAANQGQGTKDQGPILKLLDFGLARFREAAAAPGASITSVGQFVGSPDFVAPEQIEDPHKADIRSDMYSLGCTFYYALTGKVPFPASTTIDKLDGHRWQVPPPVEQWRPDIVPELAAVINRLLRKRPEDRYVSPAALLAELGSFPNEVRPSAAPGPVAAAAPATIGPRRLGAHADWVQRVAFAPDGSRIVSAARDGSISIWHAATGQELNRWQAHEGAVHAFVVLPVGGHVLSAGEDGSIRRWDSSSGGAVQRFAGHVGPVHDLALLPGGRRMLSGGEDQTIRLWNVRKARQVRLIGGTVAERHWDAVLRLAVAPDGQAVSGSRDRTVRLWDLPNNRERLCLRDHAGPVDAVAFAPDGMRLLTAAGPEPTIWDATTGQLLLRLAGHAKPVRCVAFSPDGRHVVSGSEDRTIRLWDMMTGQLLHCFEGHQSWVLSVAFSPEGGRIVSGSADRSVCVWQVPEACGI
jgi:WD40 repeat protein